MKNEESQMGLSGVKGREPVGKEVKGWVVKHKTNVCSSPGVTREGLLASAPPHCLRTQ